MPQINLLNKSTSESSEISGTIGRLLRIVLSSALVITLLGYGGLFVYKIMLNKQVEEIRQQISDKEASADIQNNRNKLILRQGQLKEAKALLNSHLYWSEFLPAIAKASLRSVRYSSLTASKEGTVKVNIAVPSYAELDKYLQIFDNPKLAQYFHSPRVISIGKSADTSSLETIAQVDLAFKKEILAKESSTGTATPEKRTSEIESNENEQVLGAYTTDDDRAGIPIEQ